MNKERYNQIIDEAYKNYLEKYKQDKTPGIVYYTDPLQLRPYTEEEFANRIKTNKEFSERWELKIEERELSLEERVDYFNSKMIREGIRTQIGTVGVDESYWRKALEETNHDIPTREITVTYNSESNEFYE
jgi:hypothetical protein